MLREYLEAMRELWTHDEAEYHGEFVDFGPSWAWPKPARTPGPLTLVGAAGNEKNLKWICRSADGWMTTPISRDISGSVRRLRELWAEAGREGEPYIVVLGGKLGLGARSEPPVAPHPGRFRRYRRGMDHSDPVAPVVVITGAGGTGITPVAADVTDPDSLSTLADRVRADFGRLDLVVTFAGILGIGPLAALRRGLTRRLLDHLPVPLVDKALVLALGGTINARKLEMRRQEAGAREQMSEVAE